MNHTHLGDVHRYLLKYKEHLRDQRERDFQDFIRERSKNAGVAWRRGGIGTEQGLLEETRRTGSEDAALMYLMGRENAS
jgi:hypothetical protein